MSQENNFVPQQKEYKKLRPFQLFMKNNFPFIENTYEALDYYGLLCEVVKFLNNIIANEQIVTENQQAVYDAFIELNSYVSNYFDNLDVQEEINNKLDDMAEAGTLEEIISSYLNSTAIFGFDTVEDMKNATNLIAGSYAQTIGYNTKNDGNGNLFYIRNRQIDDIFSYNIIELDNNLVAERTSIDSIINKRLDGCFETATGRSTIANYSNNYRSQIMGFNNPGETSTYPTRDGVGEFTTIKGRNPTLSVASGTGTIHYFSNGVQISNTQIINFDKINKGIIIDTLHSTPYSSIISDVDYENQIIYVENGWYLHGNSEEPVDPEHLPEDNIGFDCGRITFVWAYNGVTTLYENDETSQGSIGEFDICNYKENASISGITFFNKSTAGSVPSIISNLQATPSTIKPNYFLISRDCNTVIYDNNGIYTIGKTSSSDNNYVLNVNRIEGSIKNFTVQDDGTTNIIRPFSTYYQDNSQTATDIRTISHIINNSTYTFFKIQSPNKRKNEIMFVYNNGTANVQLEVQDDSNFKYLSNSSDKLRLFPKGNLILQSNGDNWIIISGNNFNIQNNDIYHSLTLNEKITPYGNQTFQLNGNIGHIHIYGTANDNIAVDEILTSLPTGNYNSFNNYAIPNVAGEIMVLKLTANGQFSTGLAIATGKKFLIDIPIYLA